MKTFFVALAIVLVPYNLLVLPDAVAQCYSDSGKHTCFEISNVTARIQPGCFGACVSAQDFLFAFTNPNVYQETGNNHVDGNIWIQASLNSNDDTFEYLPTCNNPLPDGRCVDVYEFDPVSLAPYTDTQRFVANAINNIVVSLPGYDDSRRWTWTGKVRVESIEAAVPDEPTLTTNVQPFYCWVGQTPLTNGATAVAAYKNAWWGFDNQVPVTWDSDIERAVIPYADMWYRHPFWESGWLTSITIENYTGVAQTYKVENHLSTGDHGTSGSLCGTDNYSVLSSSNGFTLQNGQYTTIDAYHDPNFTTPIPTTARSSLDTAIYIGVVGTPIGGNLFSARVYRNTNAYQSCP